MPLETMATQNTLSCWKNSPKSSRLVEGRMTEEELRAREQIMLTTVCWYWGDVTAGQVRYLMKFVPDDTFLVGRTDSNGTSDIRYNIAVKVQSRVVFLQVESENGELSLDFRSANQPTAVTLYGLITKLVQKSKRGGNVGVIRTAPQKAIQIKLMGFISRISSLKAHCRRVIRLQHHDAKQVDPLPIPRCLKVYLKAI